MSEQAVDQDKQKGDGKVAEASVEGETLLEGTVLVASKEAHLKLTSKGLSYTPTNSKKKAEDFSVCWRDVIRAARDPKALGDHQHSTFILHYIHRRSNHVLRPHSVKIEDKDGHAEKWINLISEQCHKVSGRPKKLFVIVNPIGGAGKGRQIYHKTVAPIFELAEVHTTVIVTEKSKQALEIGETQDFSSYDGIVVVGGDGLYQEVLQGLIVKWNRAAGVDYHDPDAVLAKPDIPIGIIPAGTGNGTAKWLNHTYDVETAALNIIRGEQSRAMTMSVHSRDKFVCIASLVFGYGMFSDVIKRTDELRWMKRARYPYVLLGSIVKKKRAFRCEVEYLQLDEQNKTSPDQDSALPGAEGGAAASGWKKHTSTNGYYCGISAFAVEITDKGDHLDRDPFGSSVELIIDTGCGQIAVFKDMLRVSHGKKVATNVTNLDHIPRVVGFRIKVIRDVDETASGARAKERELENIMDIDGEVLYLDEPEMEVRIHPSFTLLYCAARP